MSVLSRTHVQSLIFSFLQAKLTYNIDDDGQMMQEDVALHYSDNYMEIEAPAVDGKTTATIMYDTTLVKLCIVSIFIVWNYCMFYCLIWIQNTYKSGYFRGCDTVQTSWSLFYVKWWIWWCILYWYGWLVWGMYLTVTSNGEITELEYLRLTSSYFMGIFNVRALFHKVQSLVSNLTLENDGTKGKRLNFT